eukprot:jgi/Botrbrau1/22131/Bobra.0206s0055.1
MGVGIQWRRVSEAAKQRLHLNDKDFVPTSNERNQKMLEEAAAFDAHLKRLQGSIKEAKGATEGLLKSIKFVLSSPLPRTFTKPTDLTPTEPMTSGTIGGDFSVESLGEAYVSAGQKLQNNVLAPMERWRIGYQTVNRQMARLETLRLELDSRRHTTSKLADEFKKEQQKQEAKDLKKQNSRGEKTREDRLAKLKHKEAKEAAAAARYAAEEEVVANHLAQLIGDAEWLKSFLADVLRTQAEEYQVALQALGPTRPTPELKQSSYERQISDASTPRESVDGHDASNPFTRSTDGTEE